MRTKKEMMDLIMYTAREDERIRAVIMNGSRTNPNAKKDCFQDYDIVYIVNDLQSFTSNHTWVKRFGEIMIMQMPEEMKLPPAANDGHFAYLMQFTDGNRIDLTLVPVKVADNLISRDSLSILLLDKDKVIEPFPPANDTDYHIMPPTAKQFTDCCNEFWWVSTYVAKGLWRKEITYAKEALEIPVRNMLIKMLEWYIGVQNHFTVSAGKSGKYFEEYLDDYIWKEFLKTYPNAEYDNIWDSLFAMCDLFRKIAVNIADHFDYDYPYGDDKRVTAHLKHVRLLPKDTKTMY
ncbi:aminoglycoside 6-adenylyltransferase [Lederbergia lenta]|uniref:Putative aminoglycoside 6-adenylyltransferase n=1 Tax=Lederbergia lenta TaxID=1467 RepID=A0A2X4WF94_LEDLE|nr:aminoglycoside 6-adenylyltransferase [Lederbergia lenta]MCM3113025.1 aminoglycoside 6-adenylyltransferase [Lederbergia lenta]MEC2322751.1 aminoglycoside 6-adenylyltransferase [Lederbergia lenta]SQI61723.1 putative aminoglycoside 6-adenylyltransferase [Lederbergia lenta]